MQTWCYPEASCEKHSYARDFSEKGMSINHYHKEDKLVYSPCTTGYTMEMHQLYSIAYVTSSITAKSHQGINIPPYNCCVNSILNQCWNKWTFLPTSSLPSGMNSQRKVACPLTIRSHCYKGLSPELYSMPLWSGTHISRTPSFTMTTSPSCTINVTNNLVDINLST